LPAYGSRPVAGADRRPPERDGRPDASPVDGHSSGNRKDAGYWTGNIVRGILNNETYTGVQHVYKHRKIDGRNVYIADRSQWVALSCPAIIEVREVWERAQAIVAYGRRHFAPDRKKYDYLMARRLDCGCGKSVIGVSNGPRWGYRYYICNSAHCMDDRCGLPHVRAADLDRTVWEWVVTASTERIDFRTPIQRGEIIEAIAKVIYVGRTSMIVRIRIYTEHPLIGDRRICTTGYFSMVALDQAGQPVPVPRLLLDDAESRAEWAVGEEVRRAIDARRK
jgi:acyl-CoA thioesterase FadM